MNENSPRGRVEPENAPTGVPLVALVGAGPGDPELLTLKAVDRLSRAQVVVHDSLSEPDLLLRRFAPNAQAIDASKHCGRAKMTQSAINDLLVQLGSAGKRVVRLKGGDPCIFGRAQEERLALEHAGISYEIIPGVSSLSAAPASAGIVVTDRLVGRSVGAYSLHKREGHLPDEEEWQRMANGPDTLILFMGRGVLKLACENLVRYGRAPSTPAALIVDGTRSTQRAVHATLTTLPDAAASIEQTGPGLIVVGQVVSPPSS